MTSKIETTDLAYRAGDNPVFSGVSVGIDGGETVVIVGPSGVGKSTFLRLLVRLDEPTEGTVYYEGQDYRSIDPQALRKRIGLVPQQSALIDETVRENVTIGPRLRGDTVDDVEVERTLDSLDLSGTAERQAATLSGGEAQRVAIARTLLNKPDVLFLDEPTASLDVDTERRIETFLTEISAQRSLTCVVVTHDERQALRIASRVLVFDEDGGVESVPTARFEEITGQ